MTSLKIYNNLLRCPDCSMGALTLLPDNIQLQCTECKKSFPVVDDCPVLLKSTNPLFTEADYVNKLKLKNSDSVASSFFRKLIPKLSVNLASKKVLTSLGKKLSQAPRSLVLVVGSGRQRSWLDKRLGVGDNIHTVYSDIDVNADMDLICDGHILPFVDGAFDAVITTAVLEHVLYPEQVSEEIQRVLKDGAYLYSELPFMQQVHEGAYDFTRYTLSGHRRLFNKVEEIDAGLVAGPATALTWAIESFALAFVSSHKARVVVKVFIRLLFFWIKYFDYLLQKRPEAMDGASCTFLLGRRMSGRISDKEIIDSYVGAKHLSHT